MSRRSRAVEVFPDGERVRAKYQGVEYDGTILRQIGDTSYEVAFESDEGHWEKTTKREHIRRAEQQTVGLPRKAEAEPPKADMRPAAKRGKKSPAPKKTKAQKADDTEKREAEEAKKKDAEKTKKKEAEKKTKKEAEKTKKKEAEKTKKAPPKRVQPAAMPSKRSRTVEVFSDGERVRAKYQGAEYDGTILRQIGDTSYQVAFESDEGHWERATKREHIRRAE
jgi:hypothetical protein